MASDPTARAVVQLHVWVRRELWRRVQEQCARDNRKLRSFVAEALEERLAVEERLARKPRSRRRER